MYRQRYGQGMAVIELMVRGAFVGILAMLALPFYLGQVLSEKLIARGK